MTWNYISKTNGRDFNIQYIVSPTATHARSAEVSQFIGVILAKKYTQKSPAQAGRFD